MVRLVFRPKSDERFARQYRYEPPPEFPLASPCSGIVHHLSGPNMCAHTQTFHRRSRSVDGALLREELPPVSLLAPQWVCRPPARIHVRLLGPCFKTGRMRSSIRQRPERAVGLNREYEYSRASFLGRRNGITFEGRTLGSGTPRFVPPRQPTLTSAPR